MPLILRTGKGSALTNAELDGNFTFLENEVNEILNKIAIAPPYDVGNVAVSTTLNYTNGSVQELTATTNFVLQQPIEMPSGSMMTIFVHQDNVGERVMQVTGNYYMLNGNVNLNPAPNSISKLTIFNINGMYHINVTSVYDGSGGGEGIPTITNFTGLYDTPVSYSGANNKFLRVNSAGTGIEFQTPQLTLKAEYDSFTLSNLHANNTMVLCVNSGSMNILIPTEAAEPMPIGTQILFAKMQGDVTFVGDTGVTILSAGMKLKMGDQYAQAALVYIAADTWLLTGNLVE